MTRRFPFLVLVFGGLAGCGDEVPLQAVPDRPAGVVLARVEVPTTAGPGELVEVTVRVPGAARPTMSLEGTSLTGGIEGGWWVGRARITAPSSPGDVALSVRGTSEAGPVVGHAVLHVTPATCPPGQVREAGACRVPQFGHRLRLDRAALLNNEPELRPMKHPRELAVVGDTVVACTSDSIAMVAVEQVPIALRNDLAVLQVPVSEALVDEARLGVCEHLVLSPDGRTAFASSRGAGAGDAVGGLSVWSLPDPTSRPLAPPELVGKVQDAAGYEGIAWFEDSIVAAAKPNRVVRVRQNASGEPFAARELVIDEMITAWGVVASEDIAWVLDPGLLHPHGDDNLHAHGGGLAFAVAIDGDHMEVVGQFESTGSPRSGVVLPDDVLALASGAGGIELVDVSDPTRPQLLSHVETPVSSIQLAYEDGYLLATDWDSLRLYDAGDRGVLRLLDAADLVEGFAPLESGHVNPQEADEGGLGLRASNCAALSGGRVFGCEFNHLVVGTMQPAVDAPRLILHDRRGSLRTNTQDDAILLRASNGGRQTLWVRLVATDHVEPIEEVLVLGPGESGSMGAVLRGPFDDGLVLEIESNDPTLPRRFVPMQRSPDAFQLGDPVPTFQLWTINVDPQSEGAVGNEACVRIGPASPPPRPAVLAFFSSW